MLILLAPASGLPMYEQIYRYMKENILNSHLVRDEKLPSSRALAEQLGISRSTVNAAYAQLLSEGYIYAQEKSGYFVSDIRTMSNFDNAAAGNKNPVPHNIAKNIYSFSPFAIDIDLFPYTVWRRLTNETIGNLSERMLALGNPLGDEEFRAAIASYLSQSRGVHCLPEQIVVGAGTDYLLMLLCGLFPAAYKIAMENPTYLRAYRIFSGMGRTVNPIPVQSNGIDVDVLSQSDSNVAYVTPSHQYPLGIILPVNRRAELLNWTYQADDRYLIEDDHDSEFRYKGLPIPSLQGMDTKGRVIYLGTFSRAIAPAIRVSYMVLPMELLHQYQERFPYYSSTVSRVDQKILTEFIRGGYLERHLNKMRKNYHQKHDAMLKALRRFGDEIEISGENAGLHLVVTFQNGMTEEQVTARADAAGLHLYSLKEHAIAPLFHRAPTFLFGFAGISEQEAAEQVFRLYQALR